MAGRMRDIEKKDTDKAEYKVIGGDRVRVSRRKRRNNYSLYYYTAFFVIVITITVLSLTLLFNTSEIVVTGTDLYTYEQITQISGVEIGDNLIRLDTHTAEKCVMDNLSYVDDIKVLRSFPDKITIKVTQAVPMANIEHEGKYYVVSESGKILEAGLSAPKSDLIVVVGYELESTNIGDELSSLDSLKQPIMETILSGVEDTQMKRIVAVDISDRTDIKLNYDNRINILLGSSLDLEYKLNAVKVIIDTKIEKEFNGVIYYHNDSQGVSVIASDKLSGTLKGEAPDDYSIYDKNENGDIPLQDQYNQGLE